MRISELSRVAGLPVPTIKYYIREGLLDRGTRTGRNQADYNDEHLRRLRLIRVLVEVGGLDLETVSKVIEAVDNPELALHQVVGVAHHALGPSTVQGGVPGETASAEEEVDRFLEELGWKVSRQAPSRRELADALTALRRLGWEADVDRFEPYARAAFDLAAKELAKAPAGGSRSDIVEFAVVGTVLFEKVFVALRRLAQEHHSGQHDEGPEKGPSS